MASTCDPSLSDLAGICSLLSDQTRMRMVFLLTRGGQDVTTLCEAFELSQPTVSYHLGLLRKGGIVHARRKGKNIEYFLTNGITASGGKLKLALPSCRITIEKR
jgi:ArsR family transcriptional regulator, arsenate/arsenite/antimonite-responsive transcriptional repressor